MSAAIQLRDERIQALETALREVAGFLLKKIETTMPEAANAAQADPQTAVHPMQQNNPQSEALQRWRSTMDKHLARSEKMWDSVNSQLAASIGQTRAPNGPAAP